MSKSSLRAVLPRSRGRPRARTSYAAPALSYTTLHHALFDSSGAPIGRPSGGTPRSPTSLQSTHGDAPWADASSSATQLFAPAPQPPPTPPLQNALPIHTGPRSLPLPPPSSTFQPAISAFPPLSHFQHILSTISGPPLASVPTKKPRSAFALESAAYGIPKHRPRPMPPSSSSSTPADESLNLSVQVGEDAYFLLPNALGVSDGVGGWAHRRGQPQPATGSLTPSALFSRRLMHLCADEIRALGPPPDAWPTPSPPPPPPVILPHTTPPEQHLPEDYEPVSVLQRAYTRALAMSHADHTICGSSTALLGILLGNELRVAHLGDCALCLVRGGEIVFRSEEQQWRFNHPLQLGPSSSTTPSDAQRIALAVQPEDIVILSSDGMSDNLWDEDVIDEVNKFTAASLSGMTSTIRRHALPGLLAEALCSRAKRASARKPDLGVAVGDEGIFVADVSDAAALGFCDPDEVPFARRAREEGHKFWGGKADDISVLVAVISAPPEAEDGATAANLRLLTAWSSH